MSIYYKNKRTGKLVEYPPYKCKACGMYEVEFPHDVCRVCGWEDDSIQNDDPDFEGGANRMSLNQYKKFWEENKNEILINYKTNSFYGIELSKKYYKDHYSK